MKRTHLTDDQLWQIVNATDTVSDGNSDAFTRLQLNVVDESFEFYAPNYS